MAQAALTEETHVFPLILLFLFLPLLFLILNHLKSKSASLPPGPYPWPLIGNIHQIGKERHIAMADFARSYGPLFSLKLGTQTVVVGSSPAVAKEILSSNDRTLCGRYVVKVLTEMSSEVHGNTVGSTPDCDDRWKYLRTMCRTRLFSGKAIESQARIREKKLMEVVGFLTSMEGRVVELKQVAFVTVLNMISNALFSKDLVCLEDETAIGRIRGHIKTVVDVISTPNLSDYYPILTRLDLQGLQKRSRDSFLGLCSLLQPVIKERRRQREKTQQDSDFIDALINEGFSDNEIYNLLPELLVAGTDSTSVTTEWAMAELMRTPASMEKVRDELAAEITDNAFRDPDLQKLPYLQACLKETLRLHPPGPFLLPHRAVESCKVMNYTIPKDAQVLVNAWAIGRDPGSWEDPLAFKPERFLNSTVDFQGRNFEFIPFGAGRRICPGLPMAVKLIPLLLVSWIHFFDWSLPNGGGTEEIDMTEKYGANIRKMQPLFLIPKLRK